MKKSLFIIYIAIFCSSITLNAQSLFVEAESFSSKGGWVLDQQFMDLMGSPYLMAHGKGVKVSDASTTINFTTSGQYNVYVRTFNWTSPWSEKSGAGKFKIKVGKATLSTTLGESGNCWEWQNAGSVKVAKGSTTISLVDLTGFNGRCDAIYFTKENKAPTNNIDKLAVIRNKAAGVKIKSAGDYDFVVIGGGVAGMSAAMAAAREGLTVALINDRPILGGCNSSEIRVHLGGRINIAPYSNLGNMIKEFGHNRGGNAQPADYYEDDKKQQFIDSEKNITLFESTRAISVTMSGSKIKSIKTKHIESGEELIFTAPLFSDCTGDGTIGYLADADYRMGRESRSEHNESLAPEVADKMTMGASVQWYSKDTDGITSFPAFDYGLGFNEKTIEKVTMGEWTWETGMNYDQIKDFERIRDYGMAVVYSNWSFLKNHSSVKAKYAKKNLEWVAYIAGKRESRRLLGDHILTQNDVVGLVKYKDATASTTWSIDLHYPDPRNSAKFPNAEFKSIAKHNNIYTYPVPYRCLYSRNVDNLFMAGRNISVTHAALGTVRVMRTTAMLGEVVGMAASICHNHKSLPRSVYNAHLPELISLMKVGAGDSKLPDNQLFNLGGSLGTKNE